MAENTSITPPVRLARRARHRKPNRRRGAIKAAVGALALVAAAFTVTAAAGHDTAAYTRVPAQTILGPVEHVTQAADTTPACDPRPVHRIDRYTTWQYVTPDEARYEHIGYCSKVIVGLNQSVILGEDGHVADQS